MTKKLTLLQSEPVYQGKAFNILRDTLETPLGVTVVRDVVVHPGAVVFIPQLASGEILLVRQYRHPVRKSLLEFPAGTINAGEQPLACAQREIKEEVGHAASEWISLGELLPAPGFCTEIQHCYMARGLIPHREEADEDEIIEVETMTVAQIEKAIKSQVIQDAKSMALFLRARLMGML